eukprot:356349-Chlamydomonas_euryale.AAC.5
MPHEGARAAHVSLSMHGQPMCDDLDHAPMGTTPMGACVGTWHGHVRPFGPNACGLRSCEPHA